MTKDEKMEEGLTAARARYLLRYDEDTGLLYWRQARGFRVGRVAGALCGDGYRKIKIDQRFYPAHRVVFLVMTGRFPAGPLDHKNGNRDDNRWVNLREATYSQNQANKAAMPFNKSGIKGVSFKARRQRWSAQIGVRGRRLYLGEFDTAEEAAAAYRHAAIIHYGEFANFSPPRSDEG